MSVKSSREHDRLLSCNGPFHRELAVTNPWLVVLDVDLVDDEVLIEDEREGYVKGCPKDNVSRLECIWNL
jgi:hypothetical protein